MTEINSFKKYDREGAYHYKLMSSDQFYAAKIKKALSMVNSGAVVFDIGCGDGVFLKYAREIGARVFGMDTSEEGVKLARVFSGCENLYIGSANNLPFLSSSADLIVMIDVINYIQDYAGAIHEASRALKEQGNLVIMSPHDIDIEEEKETIPDSWQKHGCSVDDLRAVLEGNMKITEIIFIRKPVLVKILQNVIYVLRVSGLLRLLRWITRHKHHEAESEDIVVIDHAKRGYDIHLDYYNMPKSLIKKYEPIEFIIIAQKNPYI